MRACLFALLMFTANLSAQPPQPGQAGLEPCHRSTGALKAALDLSDDQVTALEAIKLERHGAQAPIASQLREKWRVLNEALKSGQTDATVLGQMLLDIENLRVQRRQNDSKYDEQALATLTAEQQDQLKKLRAAMKLQPAARQAVWLGLLDKPKGVNLAEEADDSDSDSGLL